MRRIALISVYNKTGIVDFAQELYNLGWWFVSSGGTARELRGNNLPVVGVSGLSGFPEILDGRVKTLVPQVHAGLLAEEKEQHLWELKRLGCLWIDLLCVDFYPLEEETKRPGATLDSVLEKTDIGGPTMARSAAKGGRIVIVSPEDRKSFLILNLKKHKGAEDAYYKLDLIQEVANAAENLHDCYRTMSFLANRVDSEYFAMLAADSLENFWTSPLVIKINLGKLESKPELVSNQITEASQEWIDEQKKGDK